jgi:23S rRNA (cytidine1920-2'-O)/16S rRNA (cytidine1409-2'-O)-methyltransferase
VLERTNARTLTAEQLPDHVRQFAIVTVDVSFISLRQILPVIPPLLEPGGDVIALVKPQFEAGRSEAPKGVVRDPAVHRKVLESVTKAATGWGARVAGVVDSGLPGPKGNREFFVHLIESEEPAPGDVLDRWIDEAVG